MDHTEHSHGAHDELTGADQHASHDHHSHIMNEGKTSPWQKFKMSMTMTMGMDHTGLAGREMAKIMEIDIKRKFFFALILSLPILAYSLLGLDL
mgnify:FL=1